MKVVRFLSVVVLVLFASCKTPKYADLPDGLYADVITNKGDILLNLEFENTPITVANFVSLANGTNGFVTDSLKGKPYYNGVKFHRVIKNFMIQSGDPLGTGAGGPGYNFKDEFPTDSVGKLILIHYRAGILSMANSGPTTNGSQFFITHKETSWLDGKHTVFGNVVIGQEIVDTIVKDDIIKEVNIIGVGKKAKSFKANKVFSAYFIPMQEIEAAKIESRKLAKTNTLQRINDNLLKATTLPSGLKFVIYDTKNGEKPKIGQEVLVDYAGYFEEGRLFDTSYEEVAKRYGVFDEKKAAQMGYSPAKTVYSPEATMIAGFREGLQQLKIGDKAMLFVPAHLGYGSQGAGNVIPPNTSLVFDIELVGLSN